MSHARTILFVLGAAGVALGVGCGGGMVGGEECVDESCATDETDEKDDGTRNNGGTGSGAATPGCTADSDCKSPNVCNTAAGKCVPPSAKNNAKCDPIEGNGCPTGQVCLSGVCMPPPGTCATNDQCPAGYLCVSGKCQVDTKGQPGCSSNSNCPSGQVCVNGTCKSQGVCNIPHAADRLKGNWKLDSQLHVRDGLKGFTKGLLSLSSTLQNIIDGKFQISGVPSFLTAIIGPLVQSMIQQYVPPWGKEAIKLLATIDDVIDDTRVVSLEQIQALGNDQYTGFSTWQLVEFQYQGKKVSTPPQNIPGLGPVTTTSYAAREVCGVLFIDQHKVKNSIGKVFRWAIEALLTAITCTSSSTPCYTSLTPMFNALIDCPKLAQAVGGANSYAGLSSLVFAACQAQKQTFISLLVKELDDLALKLTYMSLKGKADILSANALGNGRWYGALGGTYGSGNFEGTFSGVRQP